MNKDKHILHIDQDAFFVSVEERKNSNLIGKPVIIGGTSDRGVVASCSYAARAYGVHAAMSTRTAKLLCPDAIFINGNMDEYTKASQEITSILVGKVPIIEKASIDEHYIDMTGMDRFHGVMKYATELRELVIYETGLPVSFGLSVNKTVAKMATNECKPAGKLNIDQSHVRDFLNPLSIRKIPGLGEKSFLLLSDMGIKKISTLAEVPTRHISAILGKNGEVLLQKAKGIDNSAVIPYSEQKSIGTQCTFSVDSIDMDMIYKILTAQVIDIAYQLRKMEKLTACVKVTIRYSNYETVTKQATIPYTSLDHTLIKKAKELFNQLNTKRMLIRLVGVNLSNLAGGFEQIDLYSNSQERYSLVQAMDKIKRRFGKDAVTLASIMDVNI